MVEKVQINNVKPIKSKMKVWEEFICRLRSQNVMIIKDFKEECEWKWLVNSNNERLFVKGNNNVHKVYKKRQWKNSQNKYEYEKEEEDTEEAWEGTIGVHANEKLRIIDKNSNFQQTLQEEAIRIVFSEEI